MNNLFALAANEATAGSVFYLNSIFGTVGGVLGGTGPELLGAMFKVFNTSVLALGSIIITYTTVASILLTAHEGEALGKKFHTLWIPMRTVMGIAALIPTATGYSYLQIGLMWLIIQGIGAADTLWTTTVNYVASGQSTVPNAPGGVDRLLQSKFGYLFEGMVCQASAKAKFGSGYYCSDNASSSFCTANDTLSIAPGSSQVSNGAYQMGPGGVCGDLTLGDPADPVGQAQNQALAQIISSFGSLANQFVGIDYAYNTFRNAPPELLTPPPSWITDYCNDHNLPGSQCNAAAFSNFEPPSLANSNQSKQTVEDLYWQYGLLATAGGNFISTAANLYVGIVGAAAQTGNNSSKALDNVKVTAIDNGWIFAGGYFYYIAKANNKISKNQSISVNPPDLTSLSTDTEKGLTQASIILVQKIGTSNPNPKNLGLSTSCSKGAFKGLNPACEAIISSWISNISGSSNAELSQNPVVKAQSFGSTVLDAVVLAGSLLLVANFLIGLGGGIYFGVSPTIGAVIGVIQTLVPMAMFFLLIFLGIGATLAVYTPMIPYMLFTFGALNWLIGTVETMIAAPIVAIGLLHPEGHEMWGLAEKALMLILNIFLRPGLMIFGMIAGMLMSFAVVMLINYAFLNVMSMISPNGGILEMIFFMVLYTGLFTTSMNKCFDLIHIIPDKILRWIGGGAETFGEGGGIEKVSQAFEAGSQKASRGIEGGVSGAQAPGKAAGKGIKAAKDKAAGGGPGGGFGGGGGGGAAPPPVPPA